MSAALTSPVTGATIAGLTSPTYTLTTDRAPDASNGLQYAVTALGGTQTGVVAHSPSTPFTVTFVKPKVFKTLGVPNPVTGVLPSVPKNQWQMILRKGVTPLAGQPASVMVIRMSIDLPAGADLADVPNIRAAMSFLGGVITQDVQGLSNSLIDGIL